jgi:hypothetical protein
MIPLYDLIALVTSAALMLHKAVAVDRLHHAILRAIGVWRGIRSLVSCVGRQILSDQM